MELVLTSLISQAGVNFKSNCRLLQFARVDFKLIFLYV